MVFSSISVLWDDQLESWSLLDSLAVSWTIIVHGLDIYALSTVSWFDGGKGLVARAQCLWLLIAAMPFKGKDDYGCPANEALATVARVHKFVT